MEQDFLETLSKVKQLSLEDPKDVYEFIKERLDDKIIFVNFDEQS